MVSKNVQAVENDLLTILKTAKPGTFCQHLTALETFIECAYRILEISEQAEFERAYERFSRAELQLIASIEESVVKRILQQQGSVETGFGEFTRNVDVLADTFSSVKSRYLFLTRMLNVLGVEIDAEATQKFPRYHRPTLSLMDRILETPELLGRVKSVEVSKALQSLKEDITELAQSFEAAGFGCINLWSCVKTGSLDAIEAMWFAASEGLSEASLKACRSKMALVLNFLAGQSLQKWRLRSYVAIQPGDTLLSIIEEILAQKTMPPPGPVMSGQQRADNMRLPLANARTAIVAVFPGMYSIEAGFPYKRRFVVIPPPLHCLHLMNSPPLTEEAHFESDPAGYMRKHLEDIPNSRRVVFYKLRYEWMQELLINVKTRDLLAQTVEHFGPLTVSVLLTRSLGLPVESQAVIEKALDLILKKAKRDPKKRGP